MLVEYEILGFGIQPKQERIKWAPGPRDYSVDQFSFGVFENFKLKICDLKITAIVLIRSLFFVPAEAKGPSGNQLVCFPCFPYPPLQLLHAV